MATTRLTFLYPHLFRGVRFTEQAVPAARIRSHSQCYRQPPRTFTTSERRPQAIRRRHGKAVEPQRPQAEKPQSEEDAKTLISEKETSENPEKESRPENVYEAADAIAHKSEPDSSTTSQSSTKPVDATTFPTDDVPDANPSEIAISSADLEAKTMSNEPVENAGKEKINDTSGPLETVLHMPPPEYQEQGEKPPHLQPPPYVHHFDTYTLVQQVQGGGFTEAQSITFMKAIRGLLAHNLDIAKAGLVSKNDVENESYLFRAACSELRTEVQNSRQGRDETTRRDRTMLQHEVDILNQKLSQDLLSLKDELKGMFDDRKMAVRMEQRAMDSSIQELNYKITVDLNSDSKSEIEGMRWVLTRRSVFAILFMAVMVLSSIRYASYKAHAHEEEEKKSKKMKEDEAKEKKSELPVQDLPAEEAAGVLTAN